MSAAVADLLWRDGSVATRRREKLAHARDALRLALERHATALPDAGDLLAFLGDEASSGDLIWSEPVAYHWLRTLYDLTAVVLGGAAPSPAVTAYLAAISEEDPRVALAILADDHKLLQLGSAVASGRPVEFSQPLPDGGATAIPGVSLVTKGAHEIRGVKDGRVWSSEGEVELETRPAVQRDGVRLRLVPEAFDRPGMELGESVRGATAHFQEENARWLQAALDAVSEHHPDTMAHLRDLMRVVALKPNDEGNASNLSHSDFPGATVLSLIRDADWLADALIHEVHHTRLFHLEEVGRFFARESDNLMLECSYYSPWREEPRPLHGILHAVYVNLPLWSFWESVWTSAPPGERRQLAEGQLVYIPLLLEIGVRQLESHAAFSSFGRELFDEIAREVRDIVERTKTRGLSADVPALRCAADGSVVPFDGQGRSMSVRALVLDHLERFDHTGQCGDLRARIAAADSLQ